MDDHETTILLINNSPLDDFLGLSATEVNYLLYDTFNNKSPVQLSNGIDNTILDQLPLFRIVEEYLKIIQRDKQIKLTPLGALPKKIVVELYDKKILLDEHIEIGIVKLWREEDSISITSMRLAAELAGLVKKSNNKLTLTKNGTKLLEPENRLQLFKSFFSAFTNKFSWGYNDGYVEQPIGQIGWAFTVYILNKYQEQSQTVGFYADKYLTAFPKFIAFFPPTYSTPFDQFKHCYGIRTFERFLLWFGLVTVERTKKLSDLDSDKYRPTDLFKKVFTFE